MWERLYERQLILTYSLLTFNSLKEKFSSPTNPYPNSNGSYPPLPTHTAKGHSHQSLPFKRVIRINPCPKKVTLTNPYPQKGHLHHSLSPQRSFPLIPAPEKVIPTSHYPHLTGSSPPILIHTQGHLHQSLPLEVVHPHQCPLPKRVIM